jgi:hypothetical protein
MDSIALGKGKGMAEQRLQYARGMGNSAIQALLACTVLSLGYATNCIGRNFLQTSPSSRSL